jgi:hypothetical protein
MGIWFGMLLIVSVFSGLYFTFGADQLARFQNQNVAAAEMLKACHDAGVAEARATTLGTTTLATRACSDAGGTVGLSNSLATGLSVPDVIIEFRDGVDVGLTTNDRAIVTYLPPTATINGVLFSEVAAQVGHRFGGDISVGLVKVTGAARYIESVAGIQVTVPASIPTGALAMVTAINP